jgi:5'-nucleotidase
MRDHQDEPFSRGVAFPFVRRFLSLNQMNPDDPPVQVVLLSRNDPDTGLRAFNTIKHFGLDITRGAFLGGKSPYRYLDAYNASLFLSANRDDVVRATAANLPAGLVLGDPADDDIEDKELRVAFDFDGVLADDEAEVVYHETQDLAAFHAAEAAKVSIPHHPGPMSKLFREFAKLQVDIPGDAGDQNVPRIRIAIITARNAPAHERMVTTLREWNVQPDETFILGGIEKRRILRVFKPHMFFDDQLGHLEGGSSYGAMVHVPFGIKNRQSSS